MIEVKSLYHSYTNDQNYAIQDVNFTIQKGEIFGFLGPSGAGKSTTLLILTGLLKKQQGKISVDNEVFQQPNSNYCNRIGVSFERPNLYGRLTGLENLQLYKNLFDGDTEDPASLLKMVGLGNHGDQQVNAYSKGMKQRLVFARSMINKPEIWFLDEPTSGLDPTIAKLIKDVIRKKQATGTTVFLTTHNMFTADELCDRIALIVDGKIVEADSPKNLKLRYGEKVVKVEYREKNKLLTKEFNFRKEQKKIAQFINSHQIETIHSGEPTLEEIFIKVTGRELA